MTDKYFADKEEMNEIVSRSNPVVKENVEVISPEELNQDVVYHIAQDIKTKLFPNISKRAHKGEDNTLPRVCVAANFFSCWVGFNTTGTIASKALVETKEADEASDHYSSPYKGGYYIHEVPFRVGLKPNKELVPATSFTDELWLTTYNQLTATFPCKVVGLCFIDTVTYTPRTGKLPLETSVIYFEVYPGNSIKLSMNNNYFKPSDTSPEEISTGFYKCNFDRVNGITLFKEVTRDEFSDAKVKRAAMLSF